MNPYKDDEVVIITPPVASLPLDWMLIELTKAIDANNPEVVHHGCLGGEYGYGADFENDTFLMRAYCWCEKEDCLWCSGEAPNFWYKPTDLKVWWYKWIGREIRTSGHIPKNLSDILQKCLISLNKAK